MQPGNRSLLILVTNIKPETTVLTDFKNNLEYNLNSIVISFVNFHLRTYNLPRNNLIFTFIHITPKKLNTKLKRNKRQIG